MQIETFVRESLVAIAKGISNANQELNAAVNPPSSTKRTSFILGANRLAETIDFDLAVSATKEGAGGASAKGHIAVVSVELGGTGKVTHQDVSRIKFSVKVEAGLT